LRQNYDLRTTEADTSQRMLNALQLDTVVPVHKHEETSETVVCLCGRLEEIFYEEVVEKQTFKEVERHLLCPAEGVYGIQIPAGTWHSIRVLEPTVIFEAKDGAYK
jgi:cupin fold WbuC family metalloprotein